MEKPSLKKRDLGVAGLAVVLIQALSSYQASQSVTDELRRELQELKLNQEQYFVRKTEMAQFGSKMDKVFHQLGKLEQQVSSLKSAIKNSEISLEEVNECDPIVVSENDRL